MPIDPKMKILLVEDAAVMRKMEIKTLNSLGLQNIVEAVHGDEAIAILQKGENIDLIISDWNMPVKDGYELLLWVRQNGNPKNLPFLMATGRGEKTELNKATEAGVSSFISKPFNAQELKEKIEEAMGLSAAKPASDTAGYKILKTAANKIKIRIAHIQITDHLVLGVARHLIGSGEYQPKNFELETKCMSSWNPVANALENGTVDAAFILAPLAMDLFHYGVPIKLIQLAHKNGSICVRNKTGGSFHDEKSNFFRDKAFYIPHTMSIHHMLAHMFFSGVGLKPGMIGKDAVDVSFEVAPPVKMPEFIASNPDSCGYMVAEPLGTKAIAAGNAEVQFLSSELWENHPCCVLAVREELLNYSQDAVFELTELLTSAGQYIEKHPGSAAEIAVNFLDPDKSLGLKVPLLKNVLTEPRGIKTDDLVPVKSDFDFIQHYMHDKMHVGNIIDINSFVELKYAENAAKNKTRKARQSQLKNTPQNVQELLLRKEDAAGEISSKALLNCEGKYLMFTLNEQQYGIDILKIIEIIRLIPITIVPNAPFFVKGVINLRGKVIPVVDLKLILNMPGTGNNTRNRIIVLEINYKDARTEIGVIVDSVSEVNDVMAKDIEEAPKICNELESDFILAIFKTTETNKILLDIDKLLGWKDRITA
ncbi:MAG: chemotaxis protein CheW [Bacteroidota bacterium]